MSRLTRADADRMIADYVQWRDLEDGSSVEDVAARHGVSKVTLYSHLRRRGIPLRLTVSHLSMTNDEIPRQLLQILDELAQNRQAITAQLRELDLRVNTLFWALVFKGVATPQELTPPQLERESDAE